MNTRAPRGGPTTLHTCLDAQSLIVALAAVVLACEVAIVAWL
jgi:hypothetical protein